MPESTDHIIAECEFATEVCGKLGIVFQNGNWGVASPRNYSTIPYPKQAVPNHRCPLLLAVVEIDKLLILTVIFSKQQCSYHSEENADVKLYYLMDFSANIT
jgi:hypothetical protein